MKIVAILLLLSMDCFCQDVPFYNRGVDKKQDIGAINQNFRDLTDRKDLLSDGDVPPQYQKCIFSPMFCVNKYDNVINVDANTNFGDKTVTVATVSVTNNLTINNIQVVPQDYVLKAGDTMTGLLTINANPALTANGYMTINSSMTAHHGVFSNPTISSAPLVAGSGGTTSQYLISGTTWIVHTLTSSTVFSPPANLMQSRVLVVGRGGNGGNRSSYGCGAGGGGGGQVVYDPTYFISGNMNVVVATGTGTTSSFGTLSAIEGGRGGDSQSPSAAATNGADGASGGGGGGSYTTAAAFGGSGTTGYDGGDGLQGNPRGSGGGGGAGGPGNNAANSACLAPAAGGAGKYNSITGTAVEYADGGDADSWGVGSPTLASNTGRGGRGRNATDGTGETGGSGVVIISYPLGVLPVFDTLVSSGNAKIYGELFVYDDTTIEGEATADDFTATSGSLNDAYTAINTTAAALTAEIARAIAAENAHAIATSTHGAVATATASRIVIRDATGSFAMDTASGTLYGNASSATYANTAGTATYSTSSSSSAYWNAKVDRSGDTMTGQLTITSSITATGAIQSHDFIFIDDNGFKVTIVASDTATGDTRIILPPDEGANNYVLRTNGEGAWTFAPNDRVTTNEYFFTSDASDVSTFKVMYATHTSFISETSGIFGPITDEIMISSYITLANYPGMTYVPDGSWKIDFYAAKILGTKNLFVRGEIYKYDGTLTLLAATPGVLITNSAITHYEIFTATTALTLKLTDRIVCRQYAYTSGGGSPVTMGLYKGGNYYSHLTFPGIPLATEDFIPYVGATKLVELGLWGIVTSSNIVANAYTGIGSGLTGIIQSTATGVYPLTAQKVSAGGVDFSTITTHILTMVPSTATGNYNFQAARVPQSGVNLSTVTTAFDIVALSTIAIQASLNAVILSTGPLVNYPNWDNAYGWGDHSKAGYAVLVATQEFSGENTFSNAGNVFVGDGSGLTNLPSGMNQTEIEATTFTFNASPQTFLAVITTSVCLGADCMVDGDISAWNLSYSWGNWNILLKSPGSLYLGSGANCANPGACADTGNTVIGTNAGAGIQNGASYNTILGDGAGSSLDGTNFGDRNILIGSSDGTLPWGPAEGSNNIEIGNAIDKLDDYSDSILIGHSLIHSHEKELNIGQIIQGDMLGSLALGNMLTFDAHVTVNGSITANSGFFGDGSTLDGVIQSTATGTYPLSITGQAGSVPQTGVNLSTITTALSDKASLSLTNTFASSQTFQNSISVSGNVGVGTVSPLTKLHLVDDNTYKSGLSISHSNESEGLRIWHNGGVGAAPYGNLFDGLYGVGGNGDDFYFRSQVNVSTINILTLNGTNGYVGVGTLTPNTKLHVLSDDTANSGIFQGKDDYGEGINIWQNSNKGLANIQVVGNYTGEGVVISVKTNGTDQMGMAIRATDSGPAPTVVFSSPDGSCSACGPNNSDVWGCASVTCPDYP